jgi:hypothetical protein
MSLPYQTEEISAFEEIHRLQQEAWIYRGMPNQSWDLKTSLERATERLEIEPKDSRDFEMALMRSFRRHYHLYTTHLPDLSHNLDWLSLMHHHDAPTRLLDWTYSVYVAAYFALEGEGKMEGGIWKLDLGWCYAESRKLLAGKIPHPDDYLKSWPDEPNILPSGVFFVDEKYATTGVAAVSPFAQSQRHTIQKLISLCPGNISKSFEENLSAMPDWRLHMKKYVLKPKEPERRRDWLARLYEMGMSRAVLFPGLEGFSHSLGVYNPVVNFLTKPAPFRV